MKDLERRREASRELATKLNEGHFKPDVSRGVVALRLDRPTEEPGVWEARPATPEELEELSFASGFVDEHPEGADRGGYVPFVESTGGAAAQWDETDNSWRPSC